jgi:hypothetical protein
MRVVFDDEAPTSHAKQGRFFQLARPLLVQPQISLRSIRATALQLTAVAGTVGMESRFIHTQGTR